MISAALRASPRSEFPNVLSFAADEKVCSHLFHRVRLSVISHYVNNWVLEIMRCWAAAETKRWRRSFGLSIRELRQWTAWELKSMIFADVSRAKSAFTWTQSPHRSGQSLNSMNPCKPELLSRGRAQVKRIQRWTYHWNNQPVQWSALEDDSWYRPWRPSLTFESRLRGSIGATELHSAGIPSKRLSGFRKSSMVGSSVSSITSPITSRTFRFASMKSWRILEIGLAWSWSPSSILDDSGWAW